MNLRIKAEPSGSQRFELSPDEAAEWRKVQDGLMAQGWEQLLIHFTDGTRLFHKTVPDLTKEKK